MNKKLEGTLQWTSYIRKIYATDASAYREIPEAVAWPKSTADLRELISFSRKHRLPLIPRTAGTSLAGQVVGRGIIVDVSRHFTKILEINQEEGWVRVQPGVIRDELNMALRSHGLYFGPETSTANRAMIGGMIGNNSCGSNSIVYGSTRDHLLEVKALLSDGTEVVFRGLSDSSFHHKSAEDTLEGRIYRQAKEALNDAAIRENIRKEFPKTSIHRRNTGYAFDLLMNAAPFGESDEPFNFCKLIAGSEGTLAFITEAKLKLVDLPEPEVRLVCAHFETVREALEANIIAVRHHPTACELMDHYILDCTRDSLAQKNNRFFVRGEPKAILVVELRGRNSESADRKADALIETLKSSGKGYHFPVVSGEDTKKVWDLRKAGLGLLSNIPGDAKPVPVVEDTAVDVDDLPDYVDEFNEIMAKHGLYCVHYAHAGSGELHLRPILDLKTSEGRELFRIVAREVAGLVKKYRGSFSGEHGDGRLRGEFIPELIGPKNYELLRQIKSTWDPDHIFNPGKIVDTPVMNTSLRYDNGPVKEYETRLDFSSTRGILRAAEQCNGSGDCRKTHKTGGVMCPSYMATHREEDTTRARANMLREVLTQSVKSNPFDSEEISQVMDLCLSCKGCKSECPSSVDLGKMKMEWQYQYHKTNPIPRRTRLISGMEARYRMGGRFPVLFNGFIRAPLIQSIIRTVLGFSQNRSLPKVSSLSLQNWYKRNYQKPTSPKTTLFFLVDEFANYLDAEIHCKAIELLSGLGYHIELTPYLPSGRPQLSKGMLDEAGRIGEANLDRIKNLISSEKPLVGLEPSSILTYVDEFPDLVKDQSAARDLARNIFTLDQFLGKEIDEGRVSSDDFRESNRILHLHGHCYQKALTGMSALEKLLKTVPGTTVNLLNSGCCGMAGSFGYEKEHYEISMKIGELVLFPAARNMKKDEILIAPGYSCRHQIHDGTGVLALHPVDFLLKALR